MLAHCCWFDIYISLVVDVLFSGIILRVESLTCNQEVSDADTCCWWEQAGKDRSYYTFLRIYFTDFPEDKQEYGEIGQ